MKNKVLMVFYRTWRSLRSGQAGRTRRADLGTRSCQYGRLLSLPALRRWAKRWPERRWAVEGASGLGRTLAQQLVTSGDPVVDVPAKLAARVRVLSAGHGRRSDAHDAVSVAVAAHGAKRLGQVRLDDHASVPRLLSDRRDDLVRARTQTLNRLHVLLAELLPGGAKRNLDADAAAALLRRLRPATAPARTCRQLAAT